MNKKTIFLLSLFFIIGGRIHSQVHFNIEGTTGSEYEGRKVSLVLLEEDNREADSTSIVNGKFSFEGELIQPCWAAVHIDGINGIFTVLEDGNVRIYADSKETRCEGTPTNDAFRKYWQDYLVLNQKALDARKRLDTLEIGKEEKKGLYLKNQKETMVQMKEFVKRTVRENLNNIIPVFWARLSQEMITADELNKMLEGASPVLKANGFVTKLVSVQEGNSFVDVKVEQPDGTQTNLSDCLDKGSYTLINIWASWCGACIAELPEIRNIEKKYVTRNLKIISISIDRNRKDWEQAFKRLDISWMHVWADYAFANAYGINKIPALILISPDGIILKRNFNIEDLEEVLKICR